LLVVVPVPSTEIRVVGRYALHDEIAAGGMATVHIGRLLGPVGFSRTVAIKKLHARIIRDRFVSMFLDEARVAARVRHPNVIGTLDVVALAGELFLVMEYVHGETLARLMRAVRDAGQSIPVPIIAAVMIGVLDGLHAAHEATNDRGEPLTLVHRDISPHNILVGTDGISRVLDFGIAKAAGRVQTTRDGQLKGKLSYMAPEQIHGNVDTRTDVRRLGGAVGGAGRTETVLRRERGEDAGERALREARPAEQAPAVDLSRARCPGLAGLES
jgi:serine/threonine-protein kinase